MQSPDIYNDGNINPFIEDDLIGRESWPDILYATDRVPAAMDDSRYTSYTNQRGFVLRLGIASIIYGYEKSISWEEARRISLLKNRTEAYPLEVASVEEIGVLSETIRPFDDEIEVDEEAGKRFIEEIDQRLSRSESKDVYIYVHGYKVDFENPVLVASELWHFLGYHGAFIAYSWPTTAKSLAYISDIESAQASARALRKLVVYISEKSKADRIHILAYSAGTRLVSRLLADIAMFSYGLDEHEIRSRIRLGHIILTGSDVDRAIIAGYILDGALVAPASVTIYGSHTDKALRLSKLLFGRQRIGQLPDSSEIGYGTFEFFKNAEKLRLIDVSNAEGNRTGNGHDYFRSSPWVSSDIMMTLLYNLKPADRGLLESESAPFWTFPDDYIRRALNVLALSNPDLFPAPVEGQ